VAHRRAPGRPCSFAKPGGGRRELLAPLTPTRIGQVGFPGQPQLLFAAEGGDNRFVLAGGIVRLGPSTPSDAGSARKRTRGARNSFCPAVTRFPTEMFVTEFVSFRAPVGRNPVSTGAISFRRRLPACTMGPEKRLSRQGARSPPIMVPRTHDLQRRRQQANRTIGERWATNTVEQLRASSALKIALGVHGGQPLGGHRRGCFSSALPDRQGEGRSGTWRLRHWGGTALANRTRNFKKGFSEDSPLSGKRLVQPDLGRHTTICRIARPVPGRRPA
jgi:hypothetical protein